MTRRKEFTTIAAATRPAWLCLALVAILWPLASPLAVAAEGQDAGVAFFETKIRPMLVQHCYKCHSGQAKELKAELRLDTRDGMRKGGKSGPAVVPGKVDQSLLLRAIEYADESRKMPPDGKLPDSVIADFRRWIELGAADPRDQPDAAAPPKQTINLEGGRQFWAFQAPRRHLAPVVKNEAWPRGDIDRFILAKLEERSLTPAGDADRYTLLRRVSFDLTGLPPSPREIEAFARDDSPQAFEKVVDRLLASPPFGERWGRHWLDLTCYADTTDLGRLIPARHAWRYRDYVIRAFNDDKPFDQFIREQIAGDLLPHESIEQRREQIVATGFLAIGPWELVAADKEKLRMDVVDHQIDKVGRLFLGLTLGCARCHDHKFDPVPNADYYALAGIFRSTETIRGRIRGVFSGIAESTLPESAAEAAQRQATLADYEKAVADIKREQEALAQANDQLSQRLDAIKPATSNDTPDNGGTKPAAQVADDGERLAQEAERERLEKVLADGKASLKQFDDRLKLLEFNAPGPPAAFALVDVEQPADCRINLRGNPWALGDDVPRGFLTVVTNASAPPIRAETSGRLELGQWIASADNPLTARVAVNRVWHHLFGAGLVRTVDNFGARGDPPSHPELLDALGVRFSTRSDPGELRPNPAVQKAGADGGLGWSVKKLIREIVLSRTYQMSSAHQSAGWEADPDNRLLWRMNRRRLEAEAIRDAILAVSGKLDRTGGGPALPLEVPGVVQGLGDPINPESISESTQLTPAQQNRRTVYLPVVRKNQLEPLDLLNVFDFPDPNEIAGVRNSSTVPTQALFLLNSPFLKEHARHTAEGLLADQTLDDAGRVSRLFLLALNRPADEQDTRRALGFIDDFARELQSLPDPPAQPRLEAWARYCQALLTSNEFLFRR